MSKSNSKDQIALEVDELKTSISKWLTSLMSPYESGRFLFCTRGSTVPVEGHHALMPTCFAMRIAWQIGLWQQWPEEQRIACVKFVQSFQTPEGYFEDPWLAKNVRINLKDIIRLGVGRVSWRTLSNRFKANRRAETRQAAATLLMVDSLPLYPMPQELSNEEDAELYIDSFDWSNPWSAGSHLSHQFFMYSVNTQYYGMRNDNIIRALLRALAQYYHSDTGCWYADDTNDTFKINGAMKVYSGLQWCDNIFPDDGCALLDFALAQPFECDGCSFMNRLYVISQARRKDNMEYRYEDINKIAIKAFNKIMQFCIEDGAFSFFPGKAQTSYYGARVSRGFAVSDLHGTAMFVWAAALCLDFLENGKIGVNRHLLSYRG